MARFFIACASVSLALLGLFGMQGAGSMTLMDHGQMMEHTGCEDGHCGEPTGTACATHCLAQAIEETARVVSAPASSTAVVAGVIFGVIVLFQKARLWQPVLAIRSRDPAWIRSTIRRE